MSLVLSLDSRTTALRSISMKGGLQVAVVEKGVVRVRKIAVVPAWQEVEVSNGAKRAD